jgi:hypothetical protein
MAAVLSSIKLFLDLTGARRIQKDCSQSKTMHALYARQIMLVGGPLEIAPAGR